MSIHKTNFLQFVIFTILHLGGEGRETGEGVGEGPSGLERSWSRAKEVGALCGSRVSLLFHFNIPS